MGSAPIERIVFDDSTSDFYRSIWDTENSEISRKELPTLKREQYANTPFSSRLYRTENLLTKVAYYNDKPFLIGRHLSDIEREPYGNLGNRPMVAFTSIHECLEKALWCTTRNILPIIADSDNDVTAMLARRYEVDSIITDSLTITEAFVALTRYYDTTKIIYVTVIDTTFDIDSLRNMFPSAHIDLVLGLPETGGMAYACPTTFTEQRVVFHESENYVVDTIDDLTVTRTHMLPTPIINYRPGITVRFVEKNCSCKGTHAFEIVSAS